MLSNKWTFSLTSLVIILALALVAPYATAGEFSTDLTVDDSTDVSRAEVFRRNMGRWLTLGFVLVRW